MRERRLLRAPSVRAAAQSRVDALFAQWVDVETVVQEIWHHGARAYAALWTEVRERLDL